MAVGSIEIRVEPDLSGFKSEVGRGASSAAEDAGKGAGSGFLHGLSSVALVGGAAAGAGIVAALGIGAKVAGDLEQSQIAFETLFGNAEKASAFLGDLKKFAANTPFELPGLTSAAQKLAAAGIESGKILPIMETLGDSIASMGGGGEQIDRATLALQQMALKGKVSGEEMLQLAEAGVPAWDALASHMGTNVADAQKKVSDGLVDYTVLYDALGEKSGAALQRSEGAMAKQAQSFQGLMSTLKDTLQIGLAEAVGPALMALKPLLGEGGALQGMLANIGQIIAPIGVMLVQAFQAASPAISAISDGIVVMVQAIGPAFGQMMGALGPTLSALGGVLGKVFADLGPVIASMAPIVGSLGVQFGNLLMIVAPVLGQIIAAVMPLIGALGTGLASVLVSLMPTFVALVNAAMPLIDAIIKPLVDLMPQLAPIIGLLGAQLGSALISLAPALVTVAGFLGDLLKGLAPLVGTLGGMLGGVLQKLAPIFVKLIEAALPLLSAILDPLINVLLPAILPVLDALLAALLPVIDAFVSVAAQIGPILAPVIANLALLLANVLTSLTPLLPPLGNLLLAIVPLLPPLLQMTLGVLPLLIQLFLFVANVIPPLVSVVNVLVGVLTNVVEIVVKVITWVSNLAQTIMGALPGAIGWLTDAGRNIVTGLWNGMISAAENVWNWFAGLPGRIGGYASGAITWLYGMGEDIVKGIWNGIQGMAGWLRDKLTGFAKDLVPGPIAKVLGIGSPSRVMAAVIGVPMAQGIAVGFREAMPLAAAAMASDVARAAAMLAPGIAGVGALGGALATSGGAPAIAVYIGDTELTDIVKTEVRRSNSSLATTLAGRLG